MKIPDKLEVAGLIYTVEKIPAETKELEYGLYCGLHSSHNATISLKDCLPEQTMKQAFVHEFVHAICDALNITDDKIDIDERFVESFS